MTRLMRTTEVAGRPVVTLGGEDVAQVKDIVYAAEGGSVAGFTLAGRGLLSGPMHQALPWSAVLALGTDALMIQDTTSLGSIADVMASGGSSGGHHGDVMGSQVLTDAGTELGTVTDVILDVGIGSGSECDVVGYEIATGPAGSSDSSRILIPLPDTISASAEHLMVPATAKDFVRHDLAGFGAAVDAFREHLRGMS